MRNLTMATLVLSGLFVLSGCYDGASVTLHEPGVYKGMDDPMVALSATAAHKERLVTRFNQVQTDR